MDYKRIYDELIEYRKNNIPNGYTENHHILPRSLGGTDDLSNLVELTGREHWIAHLLLYHITGCPKMAHACNMMAMRCEERGISHIKNSRMYEKIRIECAKLSSSKNKQHTQEKNSQFGTVWISSNDLRQSKKISKNSMIPPGWVKGRNTWKKELRTQQRVDVETMKISKEREYWNAVFEDFMKSSYKSVSSYSVSVLNMSNQVVSKYFRKYVKVYADNSKQSRSIKFMFVADK